MFKHNDPNDKYVSYSEHNLLNFVQRMKDYKRRYGKQNEDDDTQDRGKPS